MVRAGLWWIHAQMNGTRNDFPLPFENPWVRLLTDGSEEVHWAVNAVMFWAGTRQENDKIVEEIKQRSPTMLR